jgi:uncharacterized protein with HEPN domain
MSKRTEAAYLDDMYQYAKAARSMIDGVTREHYDANVEKQRHRIVHDYGNIDRAIVWDTAVKDLTTLIAALERHLTST